MKRFLLGIVAGLFLGWLTVPIAKATYDIAQSDGIARSPSSDDDDLRSAHAYKWYLTEMLSEIRQINEHIKNVEENTRAVKEKLKA